MSAVQAVPSVPMDVSTCSAPSAVCVTQDLNLVQMANSATVSKYNRSKDVHDEAQYQSSS